MRWSIRKILTSHIFLYICRLLSSDNFSICFFPFHLEETSEISFVLSSRLIYSSHLTFIYQTCRVTKRNCSSFSCSLAFGFRDGVLFPRQPWGKVSLPVWTTAWESPQRDATTHKLDLTTSITSMRIRATVLVTWCQQKSPWTTVRMRWWVRSPQSLQRTPICTLLAFVATLEPHLSRWSQVLCTVEEDLGFKCGRSAKHGKWRAEGPAGVSDFRCWKQPWRVAHYDKLF